MQHSTKRISRMASAMFDLSIGGKVSPRPNLREGDIRERIKQAAYEILPLARDKQITVRADNVAAPSSPLYFEASQIEQVLLNLLDNSCKFTHRGGSIEVLGYSYFWERRFLRGGTAPAERRVNRVSWANSYRIDIKDTGPGVPPELLNHIFEEYTSYSGPQDRSGGGLGLGHLPAHHEPARRTYLGGFAPPWGSFLFRAALPADGVSGKYPEFRFP